MQRIITLAAGIWLAAVACAFAQPAIDGPKKTELNARTDFMITGLVQPPDDATRAVIRTWRKGITIIVDTPEDIDPPTVTTMQADDGDAICILASITPRQDGVYVLIVLQEGKIATKRFLVGAANPPKPPPTPIVKTGRRVVLVVDEEMQRTPEFNLMTLEMRNDTYYDEKRHLILMLSDDQEPPTAYQTVFNQLKSMTFPACAIIDADSSAVLFTGSLDPKLKAADFKSLVQKHGG